MSSHPDKELSDAQQRAAEMLAHGQADVDVARQLDRHPQTVRRWRREPAVADAIIAAGERLDISLRERMSVLGSKVIEGKLRAIDALVEKLDHEDPDVVVKSAETLLRA